MSAASLGGTETGNMPIKVHALLCVRIATSDMKKSATQHRGIAIMRVI
jgi:hypothetical protein